MFDDVKFKLWIHASYVPAAKNSAGGGPGGKFEPDRELAKHAPRNLARRSHRRHGCQAAGQVRIRRAPKVTPLGIVPLGRSWWRGEAGRNGRGLHAESEGWSGGGGNEAKEERSGACGADCSPRAQGLTSSMTSYVAHALLSSGLMTWRVQGCVIQVAQAHSVSHASRQRGDSNPCGQSPMDFESISLTARTLS